MVGLHRALPVGLLFPAWRRPIGASLMVAGCLLIAGVGWLLLRHGTEVHTFGTPRKLVTSGPFRFSRNPIYLGFLLGLLGAWIYLGSVSPVVGPLVFFWVANAWYIPFEEQKLQQAFGGAYDRYRKSVRRWL